MIDLYLRFTFRVEFDEYEMQNLCPTTNRKYE